MSSNTSPLRSFRLIIIGALALMIGLIAAIWLQQPATVAIASGTMLQTPRPLGDFNAIDENGAPITREQRSEEHTSELQSPMRIPYAVFCLKKKTISHTHQSTGRQRTTCYAQHRTQSKH